MILDTGAALEYRTETEQAEAYVGILDGATVAWRGVRAAAWRGSRPRSKTEIRIVPMEVTVVTSVVNVVVRVMSEVSISVTSTVVLAVLSRVWTAVISCTAVTGV